MCLDAGIDRTGVVVVLVEVELERDGQMEGRQASARQPGVVASAFGFPRRPVLLSALGVRWHRLRWTRPHKRVRSRVVTDAGLRPFSDQAKAGVFLPQHKPG